jgi:predicted nucleic acid-binding protein
MRAKVYIETTIVSFLVSRPSRDIVSSAYQEATRTWWERRRPNFELYVSELVLEESARGDSEVAARRVQAIGGLPLLDVTDDAVVLSQTLLQQRLLPGTSAADALHIAIAAVHGVEYLLTWNFKHIANAQTRVRIESACRASGYEPAIICTPDELMEET